MRVLDFSFLGVPGRVSQVGLQVSVTAAKGGGSAIRADGWAVWLLPRPGWERVPSGVREVRAFALTGGLPEGTSVVPRGSRRFPLGTTTARAEVRRLTGWVNTREAAQPGVTSCPMLGFRTVLLGLRFLARPGAKPLAQVVEDGCGGLALQVRGRPLAHLEERSNLAGLLWRLRALPECTPAQLRASASAPSATPGPPWITTSTIAFSDVSSHACALKGFPRVALRTASGARLPTRVSDSNFPSRVVTLAPRLTAIVNVSWPSAGRSCKGPRAGSMVLTLPGTARPFVVSVGSSAHPATPCRGKIRVDAIQ
jgi:hypothetical protein